MTTNQLNWLQYQESQRSNLAKEAEAKRSNLAKEAETNRSNLMQEHLTSQKMYVDSANKLFGGLGLGVKAVQDLVDAGTSTNRTGSPVDLNQSQGTLKRLQQPKVNVVSRPFTFNDLGDKLGIARR